MSDCAPFANKLEEQTASKGDLSYTSWASKTSSSAPPEAKRLTEEEAQNTQAMHKSASGSGSIWNSGGTFEERDVSKWAKEEMKKLLLGVQSVFGDGLVELQMSEVIKMDGDASIWVVRGKKRVGFDFNVICKWSAKVMEEKKSQDDPPCTIITGKLTIPNMAVDELDELLICDISLDGKEDLDNKSCRKIAVDSAKKLLPQIEAAANKFHSLLLEK